MLQRNNRGQEAPPPVMTWGRAFIPVCVAGIFDFLGFIFALLGIFGPVLAGVATTLATGSTILGGLAGLATGLVASGGLQMFGMIMAMIIGFFGWLVVGFIMLVSNRRIFKGANSLMFGSVLLIDEIPFINILPALSYRTIRMYRAQIKADKQAHADYEAAQVQYQVRAQQEAVAERSQRTIEQQSVNNEVFAQEVEQQELLLEEAKIVQVAQKEQEAENDAIHEQEKLAA